MSTRKDFNWSLLSRYNLYSMLYELRNKVVNKSLLIEDLHSILAKHVKSHLPVKIRFDRDFKTAENYIYVGGMYHSDYDKKGYTRHIEIIFSYYFLQERLKLTNYKWKRICRVFSDVVLHEIIHMRQFRARNFKLIPMYSSSAEKAKERKNQQYLGDRDEMGAYAFNIACELCDRFKYNFKEIEKYLDTDSYKKHKRSDWFRYMKAFNQNHNHIIIRRMKRKIINQLPNAALGRPFKTNNHLTY
jgi:hypothetical protein